MTSGRRLDDGLSYAYTTRKRVKGEYGCFKKVLKYNVIHAVSPGLGAFLDLNLFSPVEGSIPTAIPITSLS